MSTEATEASSASLPRKRSRRWPWTLAAALITCWLWFVGLPKPKPYVSPAFGDDNVHFQMQLPPGWEVSHFKAIPGPGRGRAEIMIGDAGADWRPQWLRNWFPRERKPLPFMLVQIFYLPPASRPRSLPLPGQDGSLPSWGASAEQPAETWMGAKGTVIHQVYLLARNYYSTDGKYQVSVQYHREDRDQLRPTLDLMGKTIRITR